ncbi:MAG: hypothetical protein BHV73_04345 [Bacteroides sp. 44_46]|nr:MAG: hypothetical protein BHV73_04345 [Bacteroides sp. 44_46]
MLGIIEIKTTHGIAHSLQLGIFLFSFSQKLYTFLQTFNIPDNSITAKIQRKFPSHKLTTVCFAGYSSVIISFEMYIVVFVTRIKVFCIVIIRFQPVHIGTTIHQITILRFQVGIFRMRFKMVNLKRSHSSKPPVRTMSIATMVIKVRCQIFLVPMIVAIMAFVSSLWVLFSKKILFHG